MSYFLIILANLKSIKIDNIPNADISIIAVTIDLEIFKTFLFKLRIIQKFNNGVIVTHAYQNAYSYQFHFKNAFIKTNKSHVQNQIISDKFLYDAIYTYTIVLGTNNTV